MKRYVIPEFPVFPDMHLFLSKLFAESPKVFFLNFCKVIFRQTPVISLHAFSKPERKGKKAEKLQYRAHACCFLGSRTLTLQAIERVS